MAARRERLAMFVGALAVYGFIIAEARTHHPMGPLLVVILALWATDAEFLYALADFDVSLASRALRIALDIVLLLVTVIGGRIVPAFTAGALRKRGIEVQVRTYPVVERLAIGSMAAVILLDIILPAHWSTAVIALCSRADGKAG